MWTAAGQEDSPYFVTVGKSSPPNPTRLESAQLSIPLQTETETQTQKQTDTDTITVPVPDAAVWARQSI